MNNGATTDAIDCDSIDEISLSGRQGGAYAAREKAQRGLLYGRIAKPANVVADAEGLAHWQKCYRDLWQLKVAFEKKHNR